MENKQVKITAKSLFERVDVKDKFAELLGSRAPSFITSVLQIVSSNKMLADADPTSIYQSAAVAATLDLPLNNSLGFAYIVPYNEKQADGSYKKVAQFQIGYKGFKQLALRSGQFLTINSVDVRLGEIKNHNRLSGEMEFSWVLDEKERESLPIIGYVSFFKLMNGYEQTYFMTIEKLSSHGKKYSQTFKKGFGLWKDDFDSMCLKTVTKLNLSKNAPLSIDMQKAVIADQSIVKNNETIDVSYPDNEVDKEQERISLMLSDCKTVEEIELLQEKMPDADIELFATRKEELRNGSK
jgi:recombination protein RecT